MYTTTAPHTTTPAHRPRPTADQVRVNPWLLWRPEGPSESPVLSVAELAECRCPDLCDRDHVNE